MADELRIGLTELLRKAQIEGDAEFLKEGVRALSQALMEMEVEEHIGAARHERSPGRKGQRNGYRQRIWDTRARCLSGYSILGSRRARRARFSASISSDLRLLV